jgi:hypothetical protein
MNEPRCFVLFPDDRIEEVDAEGNLWAHQPAPGLYDRLVLAGYPLHLDPVLPAWDGIIDLHVEAGRVVVHTTGPAPREHDMGAAASLFLAWFEEHAQIEL